MAGRVKSPLFGRIHRIRVIRVRCSDRKKAHPNPPVGHGNDRASFQSSVMLGQSSFQMSTHILWTHISQAKDDNAGQSASTGSHQLSKVEIVGEHDTLLVVGLLKDRGIG